MGKHELEHLRKEAEQAIADAERWSDNEGSAAIAKTLMYGFALLADRMEGPTITGHPPKIDIQYHAVHASRNYDCNSGTNCGRDDCVAHGGHGGDS